MGIEGIRHRGWKKECGIRTHRDRNWKGSRDVRDPHYWAKYVILKCVCLCVWLVVCDFACDCSCVGDLCWQLPVLQAVFAEACHCCCGLAEVNKGVQARLLLLIGSQAEALASPIKPITHSQLTPDSLSAYLAWRLRANRQRQRCQGRLYYWKKAWKEIQWERGRKRAGECVRLFSMVSAEEPKVRTSGGRERS